MNKSIVLPTIENLLPHRGAMLLLDRVLSHDVDSATAEYVPRHDTWYADAAGNMPAWIGIELMAQTIAVHVGMEKCNAGETPRQGVLLGTRRYAAQVPSFVAGMPLCIEARMVLRDISGLGAYDCTISCAGEAVAHATLKVFEPENFTTFLQASLS